MSKPFSRIRKGKKIAGVCTGLAEYVGVDVSWMRLSFLIGLFTPYPFGFAYIILALVTKYEEDNTLKR